MIDISFRGDEKCKAFVYLDGRDARLFNALRSRLGSDELAQNACILEGYISNLKTAGKKAKMQRVQRMFPKVVGISYSELQEIVDATEI
jgi:hypothetical protein